jgi:UDP-glucose 4-epimerase
VKAFVTGAAGFIGSNLTDRLLRDGHSVTGYDNFSTGREIFLEEAARRSGFELVRGDLLDQDQLTAAMGEADIVFHMAANADVRFGLQHPRKDLEQNTIGTFQVLEAMRARGVRRIAFPSTGSVYGEARVFPTPEDAPFPVQTSLYAASKLAGEALIEAYCHGYSIQGFIFRFVSILGERYTHGHVLDFYRQLHEHPAALHVLGDGKQRKSYLYVQDCIEAMLVAVQQASAKVNVLNLGTDEYCEVNDSIRWICEHMAVHPAVRYSGGDRGWIGDNPFIFLDCRRMRDLGWAPRLSIREAILRTLQDFDRRLPRA